MATRFYLPSTGSDPNISPAVLSGWTATATTGFVRRITSTTKSNASLTDHTSASPSGTNPSTQVIRQFISGTLPGGIVFNSTTLTGVIRGLESAANYNATVGIGIQIVDKYGTVVRSTLLAPSASDNTGAAPPEFGTSAATRRFQDAAEATSLALGNYTTIAGDRLVIEIGWRKAATSTTNTVTLRFGDPTGTSDFAHSDGLTTDLDPWVEFSATFTTGDHASSDPVGRVGGVGQSVGVKSITATDTAQVGTQAQNVGASGAQNLTGTIQGRVGARAIPQASRRAVVSWVQFQAPEASSDVTTVQGHIGPRAQNVESGRVKVTWVQIELPEALTGNAVQGSVGPRATNVGVKSITTTDTASVGTHALSVGTKSPVVAATASVGTHAQAVGTTSELKVGTAQGSVGTHAQSVDVKSSTTTSSARAGTHAQTADAKANVATVSGSVGTHATSVGVAILAGSGFFQAHAGSTATNTPTATTRTATIAGSVGTHATSVGVKSIIVSDTASVGPRATNVGAQQQAGTGSFQAHSGPRATNIATRSNSVTLGASVGTHATSAGTHAHVTTVTGRTGARVAIVSGVLTSTSVAAHAGARAQCVGAKGGAGAPTGRVGSRATTAGVPQRLATVSGSTAARTTSAYTILRTTVVVARAGTRTTSNAAKAFQAGVLGHVGPTAAVRLAKIAILDARAGVRATVVGFAWIAPTPEENDITCEQDHTLDKEVVWPAGVPRDYDFEPWEVVPSGCVPPADAIKPWEI